MGGGRTRAREREGEGGRMDEGGAEERRGAVEIACRKPHPPPRTHDPPTITVQAPSAETMLTRGGEPVEGRENSRESEKRWKII